ncbi:metallophosphoesterase [Sinorhizobium sp. 8-89]|uniref:metallophosphoesterase family protein n=1 Tax=Sinorhizobium sp. 7-81 TaxID=3049087 RepID=UPI0024C2F281|nr:metallophosphoesterase [Sinorhizobium sp. 7-81]MDK1389501.1 metallophosphoesterase [Sinorhizobium sp. 7-81]
MSRPTILQFSDLHLSENIHQTTLNWEHCLRIVEQEKPDLVVVSGDVVLDNPDDEAAHDFSRRQLERIPANWRLVPGNHDLGDSLDQPYQGQPITTGRRQRFLDHYGKDWWSADIGGWKVVGINSMLLASGLPAEIEQSQWLRQEIDSFDGPILLFLHKPLCLDSLDEDDTPGWVISREGRQKFADLVQGANLRAVASGHLHCHRHVIDGAFEMVWAPATCVVHSATVRGVPKSVGWLSFILAENELSWRHNMDAALGPIDVTDILSRFGTLRSTPANVLNDLKPKQHALAGI